jgi:hypothetical protein
MQCSTSADPLIKRKVDVGDMFHASSDTNVIRSEVFKLISGFKLEIDSTILDKPKAEPQTRPDEATFYRCAWFYHAKYLTTKIFPKSSDIYISAAALETNKGKAAFKAAFHEAVSQTASHDGFVMDFPFAVADPCIQVADYCSWAIQRKWERQKEDFYKHIQPFVKSEFDLWRRGTKTYY